MFREAEITICVTGHQPSKMYGYNLNPIPWQELKEKLKVLLIENKYNRAVTGMALGVDTIFALAVLELKGLGNDIELYCAIPCRNHSCKWYEKDRKLYDSILESADEVKVVNDIEYQYWVMNARNKYMVDMSDKVIAVWNGNEGGTYDCVKYANKCNKELLELFRRKGD